MGHTQIRKHAFSFSLCFAILVLANLPLLYVLRRTDQHSHLVPFKLQWLQHAPGNSAHRLKSARKRRVDTHSGRIHISLARYRCPGMDAKHDQPQTDRVATNLTIASSAQRWSPLLTPLLSRQVWLLLGHSQASPSQPSVQAHLPIMQEPRSDGREKRE